MILVLLATLHACGGSDPECSEEVACGFNETCVAGKCVSHACSTSDQCGMEEYCHKGTCASGCERDEDCYPGDVCDSGSASCATAACTDTRVDCAFQQFCNTGNGECYDAGGYYCRACQDDGDCGGNGNLCLNLGNAQTDYCGVTCVSDTDCPNGYTCAGVGDGEGNVIAYQCITYCWLYDESGRSTPPAAPPSATHSGPRP